jgi:hypothetical protein
MRHAEPWLSTMNYELLECEQGTKEKTNARNTNRNL